MTEQVKRRSLSILESLDEAVGQCEALSNEMVQMLIRGDDDGRLVPQVRADVATIRNAVDDIKLSTANLFAYVNRKQQTHRL